MLGAGGTSPVLTARSVSATAAGVAQARLVFRRDGDLRTGPSSALISRLPEWAGNASAITGTGDAWQVRVTVQAGTAPDTEFQAANVWHTINDETNHTIFVLQSISGTVTGTWLVEIRRLSNSDVVTSAVFTMSATAT